MTLLRKSEWTLLALILLYSFIPTFGGLLRVMELAGGPAIVPLNPRALAAPTPIVLHIISSFVFCIVGALQFMANLRHRYPAAHRTLGRMTAAAGCLSAASGLWMTHVFVFPADLQGTALYGVRMILGTLMIGLIAWAIVAIRAGDIAQHRTAMLRAYAIGQGASTQTVLGIGWMLATGTEVAGGARDALMVLAWFINLLVAELIIEQRAAQMGRPPASGFPFEPEQGLHEQAGARHRACVEPE